MNLVFTNLKVFETFLGPGSGSSPARCCFQAGPHIHLCICPLGLSTGAWGVQPDWTTLCLSRIMIVLRQLVKLLVGLENFRKVVLLEAWEVQTKFFQLPTYSLAILTHSEKSMADAGFLQFAQGFREGPEFVAVSRWRVGRLRLTCDQCDHSAWLICSHYARHVRSHDRWFQGWLEESTGNGSDVWIEILGR